MLPGEDFGWGKQRCLSAGFDRSEDCHQRYERLARTDIALKEPEHRRDCAMSPRISSITRRWAPVS